MSDVTHSGAGAVAGWGSLRGRPAGGVSALLPGPGSPRRDFSHVRPWYDLSSWVSVWCSVLHQVLGFTPGRPAVYSVPHYYVRCPVSGTMSAFTSGAPRFTSSTPVFCQVPGSRQVPRNTLRVMVLHMVPGFASGAQIYSDVQVLRQVLGFYVRHQGLHQTLDSTSGTQVYIMRLVLPQTPRYVRHPLSMSSTRFYIRRAGLRQVTRCTSGAQFLRQTPDSSQAPWFTSGAQFYVRRPVSTSHGRVLHQASTSGVGWASTPDAMSGAQVYVRSPVF